MIDFCKERLARFKAPKSLEFASEIPKNPAGKILKKELRSQILGRGGSKHIEIQRRNEI